jgi:acetoin utilization deacetylase AcuC-like enzyme
MTTVLLLGDPSMARHAAPGHPERPARIVAAVAGVRDAAEGMLTEAEARPASDEELGRIHPQTHLDRITAYDAAGAAWPDPDTYVVTGSLEAARRAAGATIDAALAAADGRATIAFAAVRPPGHHATATRPSGFCLFNSIAIAVAALRAERGLRRVAVVDWDVHHGDGTQAIFDADADLWYGSTHQWPLYPGTGARDDSGGGSAAGTKENRPLAPGSGDESFVAAWRDDLVPRLEAFGPEAIVVSAGYDGHAADPLAELELTESGYERVAHEVGAAARRLRLRGVALTLEGGYDLDALRASTSATIRGLRSGLAGG